MIARLTGHIAEKSPPTLVLDVQGVGYEIEAPMSTFYVLPSVGQEARLHIQQVIREDAHLLFGFATEAEKALFKSLIKLNGVGPKLALTVLSGMAVDEFWGVVHSADAVRLTKLPGVGKKTAERMVLELKDASVTATQSPMAGANTVGSGALVEARAALESLGYKPAEAVKLTEAFSTAGLGTDAIIREALKRAVR